MPPPKLPPLERTKGEKEGTVNLNEKASSSRRRAEIEDDPEASSSSAKLVDSRHKSEKVNKHAKKITKDKSEVKQENSKEPEDSQKKRSKAASDENTPPPARNQSTSSEIQEVPAKSKKKKNIAKGDPAPDSSPRVKKKVSKKKDKDISCLTRAAMAGLEDVFNRLKRKDRYYARTKEFVEKVRADEDVQELVDAEHDGAHAALMELLEEHPGRNIEWSHVLEAVHKLEHRLLPPGEPVADDNVAADPVAAGLQYTYNDATGLLNNPGGGAETTNALRVQYAEDTHRRFHRVIDAGSRPRGVWEQVKALAHFTPAPRAAQHAAAHHDGMAGGPQDGISLKSVQEKAYYVLEVVSILAQSLLGGFALIHLYMTYLLNTQSLPTGGTNSGFLHFYSPIAIDTQRTYYILVTVSLLSAVDKYTRDKWAQNAAVGRSLLIVLLYTTGFLLSIWNAPFEDQMYYSYKRVPNYWSFSSLNSKFENNLSIYLTLNFIRCISCGAAWMIMVAFQLYPDIAESRRAETVIR